MNPADVIALKRDGHELPGNVIADFVHGYTHGRIPDYQMSSWLMAVCLRGMSSRETADLTQAMVASGETIDLTSCGELSVDKHSTGGVGDKTSLIVAPLVAAAGGKVAKMSGRGLSHTGGTIDKLESIAGFRTDLTRSEFLEQMERVGLVIAGQTANLAPADKMMYALRDVTGTVPSIPLIASSIMSKKIASGARNIVLDVKVGNGAFMQTVAEAKQLAQTMVEIGKRLGRHVVAIVTDMNQPLGCAIGNALEVEEAVRALRGEGPEDLTAVCSEIAALMIQLALGVDGKTAEQRVQEALLSGAALAKMREWIKSQGGRWEDDSALPAIEFAPLKRDVLSTHTGYIAAVHALQIGRAAMELGAGRMRKEDRIDHRAGIVLCKRIGDWCEEGERLATLHYSAESAAAVAEKRLLEAYGWSDAPVQRGVAFYAKIE